MQLLQLHHEPVVHLSAKWKAQDKLLPTVLHCETQLQSLLRHHETNTHLVQRPKKKPKQASLTMTFSWLLCCNLNTGFVLVLCFKTFFKTYWALLAVNLRCRNWCHAEKNTAGYFILFVPGCLHSNGFSCINNSFGSIFLWCASFLSLLFAISVNH